MTAAPSQSFAVVGAGIIGLAVARELGQRYPHARVTVFEKEERVARHQTGHNSGVVHAGLYYEPGSLKARLCRRGVHLIREYCESKGLPFVECGKLVVALDEVEHARLRSIFDRSIANGVPGAEMIGPAEIRDIEPNAVGIAALRSPTTAVVDYAGIASALADDVVEAGGRIEFGCEVDRIEAKSADCVIRTSWGAERADHVIVCAGLQSDRLARRSGAEQHPDIVPFFGQYFLLEEAYRNILRGLVYPVPDPRYPFLGVHLTKRFDGEMTLGPNAFLSLSREGYRGLGLRPRDLADTLTTSAFWKFASRNVSAAAREARSVLSKTFFVNEARKYVPSLEGARVTRLPRGIRAQAMSASGRLLDDFVIDHDGPIIYVRNAPSPGATSSLAIAEHLVDLVAGRVGFRPA